MALKGLSKSCFLLIAIAGMERFAFKGVASNLVTYLTDVVKMSNSSAAKMVNSWCGFTSITPLLVAPLADAYWDRYFTILASSFLYVLGLAALTSTTLAWAWNPTNHRISSSFLFWSLCLISFGQGAYNPSLQALGTDQLESEEELLLPCTNDEQNSNTKSLFFQWWYFGLCTGSLLGVMLMSYIQDNFGWVLGFAIPTGGMIAATVVFSCWSRIYANGNEVVVVDKKMILQNLFQSVKAIALKLTGSKITLSNEKESVELELQEKPLCVAKNSDTNEEKNPDSRNHWCENMRVILRLLPIWTMLLTFAVIFQQPSTFFTKQGMTMERKIGNQFKIPPATLQSAITLSIMVLMPFYDKVFIPMTRVITRNEKGVSVMQRMGIGMVLSVLAMVVAAIVETKRLKIGREMKLSNPSGENLPISICWLLPQYILLGISDIFTVVGMQEFFYSEVPTRMRTMGFALYTSVFGVGSFLSALLITVIEGFTEQSWFTDDMNEARLDKYYWLLAIASALSLLLYIFLCQCYKSRSEVENESSN